MADLFNLKEGDLISLERFGKKSAENLISAIQSKKEIPFSNFIFALGIRNAGEQTAQDLAKTFKNIENLKRASLEDLRSIEDIGPVVSESIRKWFENKVNLLFLEKLKKAGVEALAQNFGAKSQKLEGKAFVLTGTLNSMTRDEAKGRILDFGGKISNEVSRNVDFVIVGENPGSKFQKAQKLGIKILFEKEFLQMLK